MPTLDGILEVVCTLKGRAYHKRRKDEQATRNHALCSTRGPFEVLPSEEAAKKRGLRYCRTCRKNEKNVLIDPKRRQGDLDYSAAGGPLTRPSREALGLDFVNNRRAAMGLPPLKRATPMLSTSAQP